MKSLFRTCGRGLRHSDFELISLFTSACVTACKQTESFSTQFYMSVLTLSELFTFCRIASLGILPTIDFITKTDPALIFQKHIFSTENYKIICCC